MPMLQPTKDLLQFLQKNPAVRAQIRAAPDKTLLYAGSFFKPVWRELAELKLSSPQIAAKQILPEVLERIRVAGQAFANLLAWAQDIDKLQIGQKTVLRLSALNQRTTPELNGVVSRVSPDVTTDQRTGQSYYTIRVSMSPQEVARLGEVKLIPGMPVEAFVQTGDRTMLSYLMKPLSDQLMRSFRER